MEGGQAEGGSLVLPFARQRGAALVLSGASYLDGETLRLQARLVAGFEVWMEGEALDTAGSPFPIHVPGHTSGSAAYLLEDRGVLITGDALVTVNLWTERVGARVMPSEFNHDHESAVESLAKLRDLPANLIVTGHGPLYEGTPKQAVEEALSRL